MPMYHYPPDWAAWFSGIATLLTALAAVGIAVWASREDTRREDRKRHRQAQSMAAPLHNEICNLLSHCTVLAEAIQECDEELASLNLYRQLDSALFAAPALERYALHLGAFDS